MGIDKTELLIAMLHTRGVATEDAKDAAFREVEQTRGAIGVLKAVQKNLINILGGTRQDLEKEGFSLEQIEKVMRYMQRCVDSVVSTATQCGVNKHRLEGRALLLEEQVLNLKKEVAAERAKLELQKNPPAQEENSRKPLARVPGAHPGERIKDQRKEEVASPDLKIVKAKPAVSSKVPNA